MAAVSETLRRVTVQVRGRRSGAGSGVIWSTDGVIVTNAHVVSGTSAEVELFDGRVLKADVRDRSDQRDLVALQVEATDLPAATISSSDVLRVGELVLAVGNPSGVARSLTTGIIHAAVNRSHWIQADIPLAPGNSGGPLANGFGEIIGINTMIVNGRGFAISSRVVQRFLSDRAELPYLGVTLQPVRVPLHRRPVFGLLITDVQVDSPAEAAQLQPGDVLVGVRGRLFQAPNELFQILDRSHVGDGLPLDVQRGSQRIVADVVLCSRSVPKAA
ncbi:trypsin-like peptidase domain-containing protein [Leptolyngbya sp. FACHB-36]|nr:trypsin-like peptidase domain-containing protein [Leptolyngbya sp. FACHB-36]